MLDVLVHMVLISIHKKDPLLITEAGLWKVV